MYRSGLRFSKLRPNRTAQFSLVCLVWFVHISTATNEFKAGKSIFLFMDLKFYATNWLHYFKVIQPMNVLQNLLRDLRLRIGLEEEIHHMILGISFIYVTM